MFNITFENADEFRNVLKIVHMIGGVANFKCRSNGFYLDALSESNVTHVSFYFKASGLLEYRLDKDFSSSISVTSILKLMECANENDTVHIQPSDDEKHLELTFKSKNKRQALIITTRFIKNDLEDINVLHGKEFFFTLTIESDVFAKMIQHLSTVGKTVMFSSTKSTIEIQANGYNGETVKFRLDPALLSQEDCDPSSITADINDAIHPVIYSLEQLNLCVEAANFSPMVVLKILGEETLVLEHELANGTGFLRFHISQMVEVYDSD